MRRSELLRINSMNSSPVLSNGRLQRDSRRIPSTSNISFDIDFSSFPDDAIDLPPEVKSQPQNAATISPFQHFRRQMRESEILAFERAMIEDNDFEFPEVDPADYAAFENANDANPAAATRAILRANSSGGNGDSSLSIPNSPYSSNSRGSANMSCVMTRQGTSGQHVLVDSSGHVLSPRSPALRHSHTGGGFVVSSPASVSSAKKEAVALQLPPEENEKLLKFLQAASLSDLAPVFAKEGIVLCVSISLRC
jgi:hypothetical protein